MYARKTKDEYSIQGHYGYGWEDETCEDSYNEARKRLKEYRDNMPEYPHRMRVKRVPIVEVTA